MVDMLNLHNNFTYIYLFLFIFVLFLFEESYNISKEVTVVGCKLLLQTVLYCCRLSYCCRIYVIVAD